MRMKMRTVVAAGTIAVAGIGGIAFAGPALLTAQASTTSDGATQNPSSHDQRVEALKKALSGLVSDGTITQKQADAVAEALTKSDTFGPGRHGFGHGLGGPGINLDTAAKTLGITAAELRQALQDGDTLAEVAQQHGVKVQTLVDALVAAATQRIDTAIAEGRLTKDRAAQMKADLNERITELVNEGMPARDKFGPGHHRGPGAPTGAPSAGLPSA